jgi:hypothetical protein
MVENPYPQ